MKFIIAIYEDSNYYVIYHYYILKIVIMSFNIAIYWRQCSCDFILISTEDGKYVIYITGTVLTVLVIIGYEVCYCDLLKIVIMTFNITMFIIAMTDPLNDYKDSHDLIPVHRN